MKIKAVIDLAIDRGATRLCLSRRQFNKIKRQLKLVKNKPTYRGAVITTWKTG